ncbi:hypothetical protein C3492_05035 [Streptomyces sp. Ru62]|uniref:hypothetical protein n=1 Tax=Streptomyces sp. Ru62 TaxID=2080745 RepID=UPI000CDE4BD8|nr:hypothetical protein [Streptomyces sp. Ru62]POX64410.1 hypothetical protein C3492_05035 [Streptomyces sp. Ru62]
MAGPSTDPAAAAFSDPPPNAFAPVPGCRLCAALEAVAVAGWRGEDGLTPRDWLSVTASGMLHRMADHRLQPLPPHR